MINPVLDR